MGLWQGAWMWCVDGYHLQKYFSQQASYKWANRLKDGKEPELSLPDCLDHFPYHSWCAWDLCSALLSVIMWATQWDWKEFHHQLPIPNRPSSLPLRGHPLFLLGEPPPEPSVALHTSHRMLGEPESHIAVTQASQVQSCNMAHYSPPRTLTTQPQLLYMLFLYVRSFFQLLFRLHSIMVLDQGASCFMRIRLRTRREMGEASLPFSVCPLPCLWFLHSLHLSASASIDCKTEKEIESWGSQGKKVWWNHMGHCF